MKRFISICTLLLCFMLALPAQERKVKLKIVQTSDVHGNYYPYNHPAFDKEAIRILSNFPRLYRYGFYSSLCRDDELYEV